MYRTIQLSLQSRIQQILSEKYDVTLPNLAVEQPPSIALGELALPVAFELAKRLRKSPRAIATELAAALNAALPNGVAAVEVAGAGYLNIKLDRASIVARIANGEHADLGGPGFRLIEHTSINPNKAAHIGHLRNAILGDTFARLLRPDAYKSGYQVGVQNYIDNTGVQVADVVVGLVHLEKKNLDQVRQLLTECLETNQRIDFYCWDLYARVSQWYAEPGVSAETLAARKQIRLDTLHALEHGEGETAQIAELVSTEVLRRHLETMLRLGIEYDFLPRESEILSLHFWDAAKALMLEKGVLYEETQGKNKGCLVMRRAATNPGAPHLASEMWDPATGPDEDAKVIVRSNGTVTYVGKDIAYHLWKFGLLPGKDFGYIPFFNYPDHPCWISTSGPSDPEAPTFGKADAIYNVIDARQNDPQTQVQEALRAMGFTDAAARYTHFSYAMVAMTTRTAVDLGYVVPEEDLAKPFVEVSGRKGLGVKADDLIDRLIEAAKSQVDTRNPELPESDRLAISTQIAIGALRFFMLRFTRNTIIAFDFQDALSFEGETGPYIQYAIVRAANIFRKSNTTPDAALAAVPTLAGLSEILTSEEGTSLWETWLAASRLTAVLDQTIQSAEPANLAKYAFTLAQQFNNFYHRHHILNETDSNRRALLLATAATAHRELIRALGYLGIEAPPIM
jgi:arginyl-tRNA synthetase